jgi:hypothetical protein
MPAVTTNSTTKCFNEAAAFYAAEELHAPSVVERMGSSFNEAAARMPWKRVHASLRAGGPASRGCERYARKRIRRRTRPIVVSSQCQTTYWPIAFSFAYPAPAQAVVSTGSALVKFMNLPTPIRSVLRTSATPKWASSDGPFIKSG